MEGYAIITLHGGVWHTSLATEAQPLSLPSRRKRTDCRSQLSARSLKCGGDGGERRVNLRPKKSILQETPLTIWLPRRSHRSLARATARPGSLSPGNSRREARPTRLSPKRERIE